MAVLNPHSIFSTKYHQQPLFIKTLRRRNQPTYKFRIPNSFSSNLPLSHSKKIPTFARFTRPTNRRNSLREKLTHPHPNEVSSIPPTNYDNDKDTSFVKISSDDIVQGNDYKLRESNDGMLQVEKIESLGEESGLRDELGSWADGYKADLEFWGLGFNPIFTVFQNKEGKIEKVLVNEDEILVRNGVDPSVYKQRGEFDIEFDKVNSKISHARFLAKEMESGNYEVPKSSSLAKVYDLGKNLSFIDSIRGFSIPSNIPMKNISNIGIIGLCGFFVIWAIRGLFVREGDKEEYTRLEKEMLRRKIKSRKEKENLVKGSVEVISDPLEMKISSAERPKLDKEILSSTITRAKPFGDKLVVQESSSYQAAKLNEFDAKVMEIRAMARRAREIEKENSSSGDSDRNGVFDLDDVSDKVEVVEKVGESVADLTNSLTNSHSSKKIDFSKLAVPFFSNDLKDEYVISHGETLVNYDDSQTSDLSQAEASEDSGNIIREVINPEKSGKQDPLGDTNAKSTINKSDAVEVNHSINALNGSEIKTKKGVGKKPRVITSVKEAKEFLSQKYEKQEPKEEDRGKIIPEDGCFTNQVEKETNVNTNRSEKQELVEEDRDKKFPEDIASFVNRKEVETNINTKPREGNGVIGKANSDENTTGSKTIASGKNENWMEKNFQTLEPVIKKIGGGFRESYEVAREKVKQELDLSPMSLPEFDENDGELDWMKDDKLREIVFRVRDNELLGRDPFYLMDEEDKLAFFEGLEQKVEKENEKLSKLHEYLHANIENLDYGADGMSVYDPPEKIIPRWKGPPIKQTQNPEFLENFVAQRKALANEIFSSLDIKSENGQNSLDTTRESPSVEKILQKSDLNNHTKKSPKTVIEGSDGSFRAGKKSGKEFWEHTKKWSQGFLDSYNNETDPEIKAVMKDIGKDLDRWITPKEIEEAADLVDNLPEKSKEFIEKKLNKVKREMELFGPQAVLSKYKEYGDQKEEDYLWWLDLPFVLCIELYTIENEEERIGLYCLGMAEDLELEPKPIHVIAFEDAGDCKNLCYIIQAHLEMHGNGNAFVVARPPKDAFREAKANGFSVTVIRKGELQLNVDQTLEEVEEQITEIGTKIYHDKMMGAQSVDMSALMNGVFGARKPSKRRRSRRELRKPT